MRYSESECSSTRARSGSGRSACTAATNSISEMVVQGKAPDISQRPFPCINTAPHPPGPGLPIAEPSVKMRYAGFTESLLPKVNWGDHRIIGVRSRSSFARADHRNISTQLGLGTLHRNNLAKRGLLASCRSPQDGIGGSG